MKGLLAPLVAAALMVPALGQPAAAETARPTLPAQSGSAHFLVHYDPATADASYVSNALADFEESYSRLVVTGGGSPNAGLRPPVNDAPRGGDGRTDVYLAVPTGKPADWSGGVEYSDGAVYADPLVDSGFLYMTPNQPRLAFRFRSAHEFMHVIQDAYIDTGGLFNESTANWAADFALPDIEPGDSQFETPFLPLDCSYGTWDSKACGNGYRQWVFIRWLSEHLGDGFVHRLWNVHATSFPISGTSPAIDRQILTKAIADEPGDATLASMYADYAAAVWDPTLWATSALATLHGKNGPPAANDAELSRSVLATGTRQVSVDHFATRYVRILQAGPSAPGDQVRVTVTPAAGTPTPRLISATGPAMARSVTTMAPAGGGTYQATVSLDAASVADIVLPLINNTATDALPFTYSAELLPAGQPIPPTNDVRTQPLKIEPGTTSELDIAYAGGTGATEAPDCGSTQRSHGGVWFSLLVDRGTLTIDPRGSDFDPAVAVYDVTTPTSPYLWGCPANEDRGFVTGDTFARQYLIYVARSAISGPGHTLRLRVDGVPNIFGREEDQPLPTISGLTITPKKFTPAKKGSAMMRRARGGARVDFTLNVPAAVRFTIYQRSTGRLVRGHCVATTSANRDKKKCSRFSRSTAITLRDLQAGANVAKLTGRRSKSKALQPGAYQLRAVAIDKYDSTSARVKADFRIKR